MKTILFRISAALILIIVLLSSCKKESSGNYYVKFKMNGNWITWKSVMGEIYTEPGSAKSDFDFTSHNDASSETFGIAIQIDAASFATGTYTPDNSFSDVVYTKKTSASDFEMYTGGGIMGGGDTRYEVTITSITSKEVKGHFTGTYLRNASDDTDLLAITEGEFVVPRAR